MQRKWRRAWLRGKPHYMRYKPVRKERTNSIKSKVYSLAAKAAKKLVPAATAAGIFLSSLTGVQANPAGGSIAAGTGSISGQGTSNVTINQNSDKLSINWNNFSIGSGEKVQFIQPGASSIALNRVLGNSASNIYGQLSANGKVFLINPNGVLFAKGAQVNVGGLVASTLNLSDKDFLNDKYTFSGDSEQGVLNQGNITAANGGYVALLGANAANEGVILAKEGTAAMGAGSKVSLDFTGDGLLTLSVDESKVKAEVKNSGLIKADGGLVVMNAKAADALTGSVVNNTGTVEAKSVTSKNGAIILTGDTVTNAGTLDASGKNAGETGGTVKVLGDTVKVASGASIDVSGDKDGGTALIGGAYQGGNSEYAADKTVVEQGTSINADAINTGNGGQVVVWANDTTSFAGSISAKGGKDSGDGGSVETSGKKVLTVADTASVNTKAAKGKTGNWLLDPADFVVDDTGTKGMTATALSAVLQFTGVTITTTADIANSTSGAINTDTSGNGDITINSAVNWSADSNVLTLNAYRNIDINANVTASGAGAGLALTCGTGGAYSLGSKITLSGENAKFSLNGNNYTVINSHSTGGALTALQNINSNLSGKYLLGEDIDASATQNWDNGAGFTPIGSDATEFKGTFDGGGHTISGLTINRPASDYVGLFGYASGAAIRNVGLISSSISGQKYVGGLVGEAVGITISDSYNQAGTVTGSNSCIGGLVGSDLQLITITNSYNTSDINTANSSYEVGGLVGSAVDATISYSRNEGKVTGGNVSIGGLVGRATGTNISLQNCHNIGEIAPSGSTQDFIGGLGGWIQNAHISNCYNNARVSGKEMTGGLIGYVCQDVQISDSNNNGNISGTGSVGGLVGYTEGSAIAGISKIIKSYNTGTVSGTTATGGQTFGIGGLAGYAGRNMQISDSHNNGNVSGNHSVGGLIGEAGSGSIVTNSYNKSVVTGSEWSVGGLVGYIGATSKISDSHNEGTVTSDYSRAGGLVGQSGDGLTITGSYNTANVTAAKWDVGGLVGYANKNLEIKYSYNIGNIKSSDNNAGGLAGRALNGTIANSYSTGKVSGASEVGGLLGYGKVMTVENSYSTGLVIGSGMNIGGLIGYAEGSDLKNCYWDKEASGISDMTKGVGNITNSNGVIGLTTGGMKESSYYSDWDKATVWYLNGGYTAPLLRSFLTPLTVSADSVTKVYDGSAAANPASATYTQDGGVYDASKVAGTLAWSGNTNAGSYGLSGLYTTSQQGYLINYDTNAKLTIDKRQLTATATAQNKVYDGSDSAAVTGVTFDNLVDGESLTVSYTGGTYDTKNAGNGIKVTVNGVSMTAGDNTLAENYQLPTEVTTTADITKRQMTAAAAVQNKVYDGKTNATVDSVTFDNLVAGEALTAGYNGGTFSNKHVGDNKTVTIDGLTMTAGANTLADNYQLPASVAANASITPANLTIAAAANTKTYDGTNTANATPTYNSSEVQAGDTLTVSETYDNKNAGKNKTLTVSYALNDGNEGKNYNVITQTATGTINQKDLTITANNDAKIYDKTAYIGGKGVTYNGLVNGEKESVLGGSLIYGGTSQGATEVGTYAITPGGLTSTNYNINFQDGTLTVNPASITDPGYIAAVQNTQQHTADNTAGTGEPHAYPPAANATSQQLPAGQVSPIQYSSHTATTPRIITTSGQTVTIAQDSPVQLTANPVQKEIAVYQTINGSTALAAAYHVDGSDSSLTLRESTAPIAPVSSEMPAPVSAQKETSFFQLTDSQGNTANFTLAYTGGSLYVQTDNVAATDMLSQNQQLITAASLVAAQDKLSINIQDLQAVVFE